VKYAGEIGGFESGRSLKVGPRNKTFVLQRGLYDTNGGQSRASHATNKTFVVSKGLSLGRGETSAVYAAFAHCLALARVSNRAILQVRMDSSPSAAFQEQQRCQRCGAIMQRLEGVLWLSGAEHRPWKLSLPVCATCNADLFALHSQMIQSQMVQ
jgi:hypothetical protein